MARTLLSKQYAEFIDPGQNADKFYLVCVWQESPSGAFIGEAYWGRRGSNGQATEYYRGSSRNLADAAVQKKWNEKTGKGYKPTTLPVGLAAMLASLGHAAPAATPAAPPATPPAPTYVAVPAPSVITAIAAGGIAVWKVALSDPDYVPSQSIDLGDPGIVRAYASFGPWPGARLLVPEPDPAKAGAFRADIARLAPQARLLFAKLDARKPLYSDTILDCWLGISTTAPVLVVADILRLDGRDMRGAPFSVRSMLVEQVLGEFEAAGQSTAAWRSLMVLPREQKSSARGSHLWLRRLSAPYNSVDPYALLRLT